MDPAAKDAISHRGRALRALAPVIAAMLAAARRSRGLRPRSAPARRDRSPGRARGGAMLHRLVDGGDVHGHASPARRRTVSTSVILLRHVLGVDPGVEPDVAGDQLQQRARAPCAGWPAAWPAAAEAVKRARVVRGADPVDDLRSQHAARSSTRRASWSGSAGLPFCTVLEQAARLLPRLPDRLGERDLDPRLAGLASAANECDLRYTALADTISSTGTSCPLPSTVAASRRRAGSASAAPVPCRSRSRPRCR